MKDYYELICRAHTHLLIFLGVVHLVISVSAVTSVQKKIIISGQLMFSSRLNQHLELKVTPVSPTVVVIALT